MALLYSRAFDKVQSTEINWKPIDVSCNITNLNLNHVNNVNVCFAASSLTITNDDKKINLINPDRKKIDGFFVRNAQIDKMPSFDNKVALNLLVLHVERSKLKELTQDNLKLMVDLQSLDLSGNLIEKLENSPFEFNKKLIFINLQQNKITYIELGTFNSLQDLKHLYLLNNICYTMGSNSKTKDDVKKLIKNLNTNSCSVSNENNNIKLRTTKKHSSTTTLFPIPSTHLSQYSIQNYSSILATSTQISSSTTSRQSISPLNLISTISKAYEEISSQKSYIIILLWTIFLVFIVILICVTYNTVTSSKFKRRTSRIQQQSEEYEKISSMNCYSTLEHTKSDNQEHSNQNSFDLYIYDTQDDIYTNPLDDIEEENSDHINDNSTEHQNQDDFYESINEEVYQKISCDNSEASKTVELADDLYNDPQDSFDQNLNELLLDTGDYAKINHLQINDHNMLINQQNISASYLVFDETKPSAVTEDFYAKFLDDRQQEAIDVIYATVQKN